MTWYQPNVTGTLPPARAYHTTNLIGRKLFVFGGRAGNKYYNDLHILNLGTLFNLIEFILVYFFIFFNIF